MPGYLSHLQSSREESYYDIQLNVKGNKTLEAAFKDYIQVNCMELCHVWLTLPG